MIVWTTRGFQWPQLEIDKDYLKLFRMGAGYDWLVRKHLEVHLKMKRKKQGLIGCHRRFCDYRKLKHTQYRLYHNNSFLRPTQHNTPEERWQV